MKDKRRRRRRRMRGGGRRREPDTHHLLLVLYEDAEFLEERGDQDEQLKVVPFQGLHQHLHNVLVPHLHLHLQVLRQVQQQVESHCAHTYTCTWSGKIHSAQQHQTVNIQHVHLHVLCQVQKQERHCTNTCTSPQPSAPHTRITEHTSSNTVNIFHLHPHLRLNTHHQILSVSFIFIPTFA